MIFNKFLNVKEDLSVASSSITRCLDVIYRCRTTLNSMQHERDLIHVRNRNSRLK